MTNYVVLIILSTFTVLSIMFQLRSRINLKKVWRLDKFGVIPNYSFFAPLPLTSDYRIIYRVTSQEKGHDSFKEVCIYQFKHWYQFIFNPFKYYNKGLIDLCVGLVKEYNNLEQDSKNFIQISSNYISILNVVIDNLKLYENTNEVEFGIVVTKDKRETRESSIVFRSFKHKIE